MSKPHFMLRAEGVNAPDPHSLRNRWRTFRLWLWLFRRGKQSSLKRFPS